MKFGPHPVRQIAFFTDDIAGAARRHSAAFGSGPFILMQSQCTAVDRGREVAFTSNYCVGQWGEVVVEFITSTSVPTVMCELPLDGRRQRFHHVALIVDDLDAEIARFEAMGYPLVHLGTPVAMPEFRFAFLDATTDLGMYIELYARDMAEDSYGMLRQLALDWDGADPVRMG